MNKTLLAILATTGLLFGASAANAGSISISDTSGTNGTDVSGTLSWIVSAPGDGADYTVTYTVSNDDPAAWTTRLTGIGVDVFGTVVSVDEPTDWSNTLGGTLPGIANPFDVCWWPGSNCGSGGNVGLTGGQSLAGFVINFDYMDGTPTVAAVDAALQAAYDNGDLKACLRFISIPGDQGNGAGSDVACQEGLEFDVPAPAPLALIGLGLLGLGLTRRMKRA